MVAWRVRHALGFDEFRGVQGVADPAHPDNIIFDIAANGSGPQRSRRRRSERRRLRTSEVFEQSNACQRGRSSACEVTFVAPEKEHRVICFSGRLTASTGPLLPCFEVGPIHPRTYFLWSPTSSRQRHLASCLSWVKNGSQRTEMPLLLYPQKRTSRGQIRTAALRQNAAFKSWTGRDRRMHPWLSTL
jgi:hypothetical protein